MILPTELLTGIPPTASYATITGLIVLESILPLSPFVPTLGLLLVAGGLAQSGALNLPAIIACAAAGAVLGDLQAQQTGYRLGDGLRGSRLGRRIPTSLWERASAATRRWGRSAVLVCRFVPLLRTVAPHAAGAAGVSYRRLAPFSLAAGLAWASMESGVGYAVAAGWSWVW
ncbi:DedA family protein [Streptomyces sp. NPDC090442]|uniref:DedA family protein n=1 Tax=Streptomyces sp. NPDC090442 TaxID=3365962 RepID=UPI0038103898